MMNSAQGGRPNPEADDDQQEPGLHRETVEDLEPSPEGALGAKGGKGKLTADPSVCQGCE
jgi:hypothetical protein